MKPLSFSSLAAVVTTLALLLWPAAGHAQAPPPATLVITQAEDGATVSAALGQAIDVELRGNPSTGYDWALTSFNGDSVLTNGPVTFTPDQPGLVGSPGTWSFPFLAAQAGNTTLTFEYEPPGGGLPPESFTVTIQVAPPPSLSIKLLGSNLVLSWPIANSTGFFLEGATTLEPLQWAALNVQPLAAGTNYTVTLGAGGGALFFRLHQQ